MLLIATESLVASDLYRGKVERAPMTSTAETESLKQPVCIIRVAKIASIGIITCLVIFFASFVYAPVSDAYVLFSFLTGVLLITAAFLQAAVRSSALYPIVKFALLIPILSLFILPSVLPRQFFPEYAEHLYWVHDLSMFGAGLCAGLLLFRRRAETFLHLEQRTRKQG
jgi:ABC-type transport system involved in cytochrome c biogenesis permease subunit